MFLPVKDLQTFLKVDPDGQIGHDTINAAATALGIAGIKTTGWSDGRLIVGAEQLFLAKNGYDGAVDGYEGPLTREAWSDWVRQDREAIRIPNAPVDGSWPYQSEVDEFYGEKGENQ